MAVPKKRRSLYKKNIRKGGSIIKKSIPVNVCEKCGSLYMFRFVCKKCYTS